MRALLLASLIAGLACAAPAPPAPAPASYPFAPLPADWAWENPLPVGDDLFALAGAPDELYAAGAQGLLLRSRDRAHSWEVVHRGGPSLFALWYSPEEVYAAGAQGACLRSRDHGDTWTACGLRAPSDLLALWGDARGTRLAVGSSGIILRSQDRGDTWTPVESKTTAGLSSLVESEGALYAAGQEGTLLRSQDAGATWAVLPALAPLRAEETDGEHDHGHVHRDALPAVMGLSAHQGVLYAATLGAALRLSPRASGPPTQDELARCASRDGFRALAGPGAPWFLTAGSVLAEADGAWHTRGRLPAGSKARALWRAPDDAFALVAGARGLLAKSTDRGATWTANTPISPDDLNALSIDGPARLALSHDTLFVQAREGEPWQPRPLPASALPSSARVLWRAPGGVLYLGGLRVALRSEDEGKTFAPLPGVVDPAPEEPIHLVSISGNQTGLVALLHQGQHSDLFVSHDGGKSFRRAPAPRGAQYSAVRATSTGELVIVGARRSGTRAQGAIFVSRDGATRWREIAAPRELLGLDTDPDGNLYAVGRQGLVLTSQDQGATWQPRESGTSDHLSAAYACGPGRVLAFSSYPGAHYSGDGGATWQDLPGLPPRILRAAAGPCEALWLAGESGTTLRNDKASAH